MRLPAGLAREPLLLAELAVAGSQPPAAVAAAEGIGALHERLLATLLRRIVQLQLPAGVATALCCLRLAAQAWAWAAHQGSVGWARAAGPAGQRQLPDWAAVRQICAPCAPFLVMALGNLACAWRT